MRKKNILLKSLDYMNMTKSENIVSTIPFTEIESFVIPEKL